MHAAELFGGVLVVTGVAFLLLGTVGLLRFPDVYARLHALAKTDNAGLGLICFGLGLHSGSLLVLLKLLLVWILLLLASATGAGLIARAATARGIQPRGEE